MEQIIHKKPQLLLKGPLHITGRVRQRLNRPYGPFAASLSWASIAWRRAGVYSSSADGSMGMMLMIPPETLNSSRSPGLMPARRLTLEGTTSCFLSLTTTVIAKFKPARNGRIALLGGPAQGPGTSNNSSDAIHVRGSDKLVDINRKMNSALKSAICVAPNSRERPRVISPRRLQPSCAYGQRILWPHTTGVKINDLDLGERHLVTLTSDGKRIQSFGSASLSTRAVTSVSPLTVTRAYSCGK